MDHGYRPPPALIRQVQATASQPTSSSNANAPQAAETHATATPRDGARPHGGATSTPPPTPQASWTWNRSTGWPAGPREVTIERCDHNASRVERAKVIAICLKNPTNYRKFVGLFVCPRPFSSQLQLPDPGQT